MCARSAPKAAHCDAATVRAACSPNWACKATGTPLAQATATTIVAGSSPSVPSTPAPSNNCQRQGSWRPRPKKRYIAALVGTLAQSMAGAPRSPAGISRSMYVACCAGVSNPKRCVASRRRGAADRGGQGLQLQQFCDISVGSAQNSPVCAVEILALVRLAISDQDGRQSKMSLI